MTYFLGESCFRKNKFSPVKCPLCGHGKVYCLLLNFLHHVTDSEEVKTYKNTLKKSICEEFNGNIKLMLNFMYRSMIWVSIISSGFLCVFLSLSI